MKYKLLWLDSYLDKGGVPYPYRYRYRNEFSSSVVGIRLWQGQFIIGLGSATLTFRIPLSSSFSLFSRKQQQQEQQQKRLLNLNLSISDYHNSNGKTSHASNVTEKSTTVQNHSHMMKAVENVNSNDPVSGLKKNANSNSGNNDDDNSGSRNILLFIGIIGKINETLESSLMASH